MSEQKGGCERARCDYPARLRVSRIDVTYRGRPRAFQSIRRKSRRLGFVIINASSETRRVRKRFRRNSITIRVPDFDYRLNNPLADSDYSDGGRFND